MSQLTRQLVGNDQPPQLTHNLQLIFDYPVYWTKYKILRDLLQNFYDAVGPENWAEQFRWRIENNCLYLTAEKVGFSYEWLLHIGASTKRNTSGHYAGYFGEGFKNAALCALRDHHWNIELVSRDWELMVNTDQTTVEQKILRTLSYQLWTHPTRSYTELCLWPFMPSDHALFETVRLSFFYPQNPLLGDKIWESHEGAVYLRSKTPRPVGYPRTDRCSGDGIVFTSFQALGSLAYPLVIAQHRSRQYDRERNSLFKMQTIEALQAVASLLPPTAASALLTLLRREWYRYPRKRYDFESYHNIIRTLVYRVSTCPNTTQEFRAKYPNCLVAEHLHCRDTKKQNERRQALAWLRSYPTKYKRVQSTFRQLGYTTLEELCRDNDGFTVMRAPTSQELVPLRVLAETTKNVFSSIFGEEELPPCRVLKSEAGAWAGMTECIPRKKGKKRFSQYEKRYILPYVAMKQYMLSPESFGEALSTYLHELAHMFGSDSSASFSYILTEIARLSIEHASDLSLAQHQWRDCFSAQK